MIVLDASTALSALLHDGPARQAVANQQLHAPHLVDVEVTHVLRRLDAQGILAGNDAHTLLVQWERLALTRYPIAPLLSRMWELRTHVSPYDACYAALAERLECALVTADARLSRAPGLHCPITLMPR